MKKGFSLFQKKEKPSIQQQIIEADSRLRGLQKKYSIIIEKELRTIRYNKDHRLDTTKSTTSLKNAYYSLSVVNLAQDRLQEMSSINELCKAMNELGSVLKVINGISGKAQKVNVRKLNKNIDKLSDEKTGIGGLYNKPIDSLVDDSVVERLLRGDELEDCLYTQDGIAISLDDVIPYSEDYLGELNDSDLNIDESMADIDALIRDL